MDDYVVIGTIVNYQLLQICILSNKISRFRLCKGSVKHDKCRSSHVRTDRFFIVGVTPLLGDEDERLHFGFCTSLIVGICTLH